MKNQNKTPASSVPVQDSKKDTPSSEKSGITSQDLIIFENRLKDSLAKFISFEAYSLYFPINKVNPLPKWLPNEKKLLLPLIYNDKLLGIFAASNVSIEKGELGILGQIASLCLENLALFKKSLLEPGSGLHTRQHLLEYMAAAIEEIQNSMQLGPGVDGKFDLATPASNFGASFGGSFSVLTANFSPLAKVSREYGFAFADKFTAALAEAFKAALPEQALAASISDTVFAVYLPNRAYSECTRLGREVCEKMGAVELSEPLTKVKVSLPVAVGFACYPLDLEPGFTHPSPLEQGMQVLRRARLASGRAWDVPHHIKPGTANNQSNTEVNLLGFSEIIMHAGKVLQALPMGRVEANLGLGMGAREGMHFRVFAAGTADVVGEITLSSVQESIAQAEIIHLSNPARSVMAGDRLELLADIGESLGMEEGTKELISSKGDQPDAAEKKNILLSHRNFLANFAAERENATRFSLALIRLFPSEAINPEAPEALSETELLNNAVELVISSPITAKGAFAARYGLHNLIFYIPPQDSSGDPLKEASELEQTFAQIFEKLEQNFGIKAACGISTYPFLNYRRSDSLDNASKALDYAMLLDSPRVGAINSLALNIRADRYFSQGDIFAAINEYKQALLADEGNTWAWTSLGVCFASIGNREESRRSFEKALAKDPDDIMALYNLAQVLQAEGDAREAKQYYQKCLELQPDHVFSLLRLGQMAESSADYEQAREYFQKAIKQPQGEGAASRQLARIALAQKNPDEAREHLHKALARNPNDSMALSMLAEIYLNAGDNPEIALTLARQSVALRPDYALGWLGLARAYDACNEPDQAQRARLRASEI